MFRMSDDKDDPKAPAKEAPMPADQNQKPQEPEPPQPFKFHDWAAI